MVFWDKLHTRQTQESVIEKSLQNSVLRADRRQIAFVSVGKQMFQPSEHSAARIQQGNPNQTRFNESCWNPRVHEINRPCHRYQALGCECFSKRR